MSGNNRKQDVKRKVWMNIRNYAILFFAILSYIVIGSSFVSDNSAYPVSVANALYNIFIMLICFTAYTQLKKDGHVKETVVSVDKKSLILFIVSVIFFCIGILFGFSFVSVYIHDFTMDMRQEALSKLESDGLYILAACTVVPLAEESMMRLFLYNLLKTNSHWVVSMCMSSFVFALFHATFSHMIFAFLFGCMMCLLYDYFGRWWVSVAVHILYNIMSVICSGFIDQMTSWFFAVGILFFALSLFIIVRMFIFVLHKRRN